MSITVAFNTANLVAYHSHFHFKLADWGKQHALAAEKSTPEQLADFLRKIHFAGYDAAEIWVALVEKCADDPALAEQYNKVIQASGIKPVALGGSLNDRTARICQRLNIPATCGGFGGSDKATVLRLMREPGIQFNYENHPEKSVAEISQRIDAGETGMGICLDTGWLGTQGIDAPKAVRQLGRLIRHVHVKDVQAAGKHETVPLGRGIVDIPGVLRELKATGYDGVLSWEDEPEDRNPFDIANESRQYILRQWDKPL